ncbi:MAG: hypothetical protein WCR36_01035 [Bacteroidaceae bacterium]
MKHIFFIALQKITLAFARMWSKIFPYKMKCLVDEKFVFPFYTIWITRGIKSIGKNVIVRPKANLIHGVEYITIGDNTRFGANLYNSPHGM